MEVTPWSSWRPTSSVAARDATTSASLTFPGARVNIDGDVGIRTALTQIGIPPDVRNRSDHL